MPSFPGSCYCGQIRYTVTLDNPDDDARTSLCHCRNCKKFTGGPFGITTKVPSASFRYAGGLRAGAAEGAVEGLNVHEADNGSGVVLRREFCAVCGSGVLEFGANAGEFVYVFYGTFDKPEELPPKGEFFCKVRDRWMPEIPGLFHKQEIKD